MSEDKGHEKLILDLQELFYAAKTKEFHDFENETYAAPKMQLVAFLEEIKQKTIKGEYDN